MNSRFWNYIDGVAPYAPPLPLVHTADSFALRSIAESSTLQVSRCTVFTTEDLLYLYYGRPAYRPNQDMEPTKFVHNAPACIILNPGFAPNVRRSFPFDSGAFAAKIFDRHMHPRMTISDFQLSGGVKGAQMVVTRFYSDNIGYFRSKPRKPLEIPSDEFEAQSFYSLILDESAAPYDDRNSAIEIQSDKPITLSADCVESIILPDPLLESDTIIAAIDKWDADVHGYPLHRGSGREFQGLIYERVETFLTNKRLI